MSSRSPEPTAVHLTQAQDQQKAPHALQHLPAALPRAQVPTETVPLHRRTGRVLQLPQPHRDSGQDLVPEQEGEGQETPRGRAGKVQMRLQTHSGTVRAAVPPGIAIISVWTTSLFPTASTDAGTIQRTCVLWDVLFVLKTFT